MGEISPAVRSLWRIIALLQSEECELTNKTIEKTHIIKNQLFLYRPANCGSNGATQGNIANNTSWQGNMTDYKTIESFKEDRNKSASDNHHVLPPNDNLPEKAIVTTSMTQSLGVKQNDDLPIPTSITTSVCKVGSTSDILAGDHQGWLIDQLRGTKAWCAISRKMLHVFESETSRTCRLVINLQGCRLRQLELRQGDQQGNGLVRHFAGKSANVGQKFQFILENWTSRQRHLFGATSSGELDQWMHALEDACGPSTWSHVPAQGRPGATFYGRTEVKAEVRRTLSERRTIPNTDWCLSSNHTAMSAGKTTFPSKVWSHTSAESVEDLKSSSECSQTISQSGQNETSSPLKANMVSKEFRETVTSRTLISNRWGRSRALHRSKSPWDVLFRPNKRSLSADDATTRNVLKTANYKEMISKLECTPRTDSPVSLFNQALPVITTRSPTKGLSHQSLPDSNSSPPSRTADCPVDTRGCGPGLRQFASDLKDRLFRPGISADMALSQSVGVKRRDLTDISMSGRLKYRRAEAGFTWIYCVLSLGHLYGFQSESKDEVARLRLALSQCTVKYLAAVQGRSESLFTFKVVQPNCQSIFLCAGDPRDMVAWMMSMQLESARILIGENSTPIQKETELYLGDKVARTCVKCFNGCNEQNRSSVEGITNEERMDIGPETSTPCNLSLPKHASTTLDNQVVLPMTGTTLDNQVVLPMTGTTQDSQVVPNEEMIVPNEEMIVPNEEMIVPNEEMIVPNEEMIVPNEEMIVPNDSSLSLGGNVSIQSHTFDAKDYPYASVASGQNDCRKCLGKDEPPNEQLHCNALRSQTDLVPPTMPHAPVAGPAQHTFHFDSPLHDDVLKEAWSNQEDFLLEIARQKLRARDKKRRTNIQLTAGNNTICVVNDQWNVREEVEVFVPVQWEQPTSSQMLPVGCDMRERPKVSHLIKPFNQTQGSGKLKQGHLDMLGLNDQWQRHWCVMNSECILFYLMPEDTVPTEIIPLAGHDVTLTPSQEKQCLLNLKHPQKTVVNLRAGTPEECTHWFESIQLALEHLRKSTFQQETLTQPAVEYKPSPSSETVKQKLLAEVLTQKMQLEKLHATKASSKGESLAASPDLSPSAVTDEDKTCLLTRLTQRRMSIQIKLKAIHKQLEAATSRDKKLVSQVGKRKPDLVEGHSEIDSQRSELEMQARLLTSQLKELDSYLQSHAPSAGSSEVQPRIKMISQSHSFDQELLKRLQLEAESSRAARTQGSHDMAVTKDFFSRSKENEKGKDAFQNVGLKSSMHKFAHKTLAKAQWYLKKMSLNQENGKDDPKASSSTNLSMAAPDLVDGTSSSCTNRTFIQQDAPKLTGSLRSERSFFRGTLPENHPAGANQKQATAAISKVFSSSSLTDLDNLGGKTRTPGTSPSLSRRQTLRAGTQSPQTSSHHDVSSLPTSEDFTEDTALSALAASGGEESSRSSVQRRQVSASVLAEIEAFEEFSIKFLANGSSSK